MDNICTMKHNHILVFNMHFQGQAQPLYVNYMIFIFVALQLLCIVKGDSQND
jgi:hypothetical protein